MKSMPLIVGVLLVGLMHARSHASNEGDEPRGNLLKLEHEWDDAIVRRDAKTLDRILAEDYLLITPDGQVVTKTQLLESLQGPRVDGFELKSITEGETASRVYGNTAVVLGNFTIKGQVAGQEVETPFRHTDVFVRRDGRWRCVSRHSTRIIVAEPVDVQGAAARRNSQA